jgi:branched-chain amino acid transport system substrate-binding protein
MESTTPRIARYWAEVVNARGGIHGLPLEVVVADNANSPLGSRRSAADLIRAGVVAVIGGWRSSNALALAEELQRARIPMIATCASNPAVTLEGDCIFRVHFTDSFQGAALAYFAHTDLAASRVAIVTDIGNTYSPHLADVFATQFRDLGGETLWQREILPGVADLEPVCDAIAESRPDLVFLPLYERGAAEVIAAVRARGLNTAFLGGDGWDPSMIYFAGDAVDGAYYSATWHRDVKTPTALKRGLEAWEKARGGPLSRIDINGLAYDACLVLEDALRRTTEPGPETLRCAIAATSGLQGLTGTYTFDRNGDPVKPLCILRFLHGDAAFVRTVDPPAIRLALVLAMTGSASVANRFGLEAARFAVRTLNDRGGVLARRIELLEYDNGSTVLGSRAAAEQAIADGAVAVVGAFYSSHSLAVATVLQEHRVPMVTPSSTHPDITRNRDFVFRTCCTDETQGSVMATFALKGLHARTAAVLVNASHAYSTDLARFFRDRFEPRGTVVLEAEYVDDTTDFAPLLEPLDTSPDVIFVPGYIRDSAFAISQARAMGITSTFLGGDGWDELMYEYAGPELEKAYFTEHWHRDLPGTQSRGFAETYAKQYGRCEGIEALTYDAVCLVADAIRRAAGTDRTAVRDALAATRSFDGVTGRIAFDLNGDPLKPVLVLRFSDGRTVPYALHEPDAHTEGRLVPLAPAL